MTAHYWATTRPPALPACTTPLDANRADDYKAKMLAGCRVGSSSAAIIEPEHGCLCGKQREKALSIIDSSQIYGHIDRMNRRDESS